MELGFIFAQTFGVIAWILMVVSYYRKNTDKIIFVQLLSLLFYCLNYIFLGAYTGMIIIIFELIRDYLYYKTDKDDWIFAGSLGFYAVLAYFSRGNLIELIPILASLLEGFSLTKKKGVVVSMAIFVYTMWIVYDLKVMSYTGAITDAIIVGSNLIVLFKYFKLQRRVDNFRIYGHHIVKDNIFNALFDLDKQYYPKELLWDSEHQKELYQKNKDTFSIIKYQNEVIGYINYLVITKKEYDEILHKDNLVIDYKNSDILNYSDIRKNYIIIDSIVIDEKYDNKKTVELYEKAILRYIKRKKREGYEIGNIVAIGVTSFEKNVLDKSILKYKKELKDKNILYSYKDLEV